MVKFTKGLIKKALTGIPREEWEGLVPFVQAAINHSVSRATGFSPHEIFFAEAPVPLALGEVGSLPTVDFNLGSKDSQGEIAEYVQHAHEYIRTVREKA
jgi:hypothetical protein